MRVAYADEYPWQQCDCGWRLWLTPIAQPCEGCGKVEHTKFVERINPHAREVGGYLYLPERR